MSERDARLALLVARCLGGVSVTLAWISAAAGAFSGDYEVALMLLPTAIVAGFAATLGLDLGAQS